MYVQIAAAAWLASWGALAQTPVAEWQYHAPFRTTQRVAVMHDRVLALSEFGITSLEWPDRVLAVHSSVEGLSGVGLTGLAASPDGSFALLGYRDGRIDRWTPDDVRTLDDIPRSGQFQGRTEVLEFAFASADRVFAATSFGVVELDLQLNAVRGTYRMRTNSDPTYVVHGVVHYCVTNMPGAVAQTSTLALNNATLPYVRALANDGFETACGKDPGLAAGLNVSQGRIVHSAVAEALGLSSR